MQPRTSTYYRRYAEELRAVAEKRFTHAGLLATLDLAKAYDEMADAMAVVEKNMADELSAIRKLQKNTKIEK